MSAGSAFPVKVLRHAPEQFHAEMRVSCKSTGIVVILCPSICYKLVSSFPMTLWNCDILNIAGAAAGRREGHFPSAVPAS